MVACLTATRRSLPRARAGPTVNVADSGHLTVESRNFRSKPAILSPMGRGFRGTRRTTISVVGQLSSVLAILVAAVAFIVAGPAAARDLPVHAALASSHGPRSHGQPRQVASTVVQHALPTFEPGPGETYVGVSSTETGPSYSGFLHSTGLRHVAIWDLFTSPNQDFGGILSHIRTVGDTAMLDLGLPG